MRALITGITGQDGYYLSKLLLSKGYEVFGLLRYASYDRPIPDVQIVRGDLLDVGSLESALKKSQPNEVYNLAAMSHVGHSFKTPSYAMQVNAVGTVNLLEAIRQSNEDIGRPRAKFYQASTSELFGTQKPPQSERTPFHPRSPYGVSKLAAYWATVNYREAYKMFASNGILFNHESPKRNSQFVTQKVCQFIKRRIFDPNSPKTLKLGNLEAIRDWGHADDFVEGMWRILQQDKPNDYVLATGVGRSVEELLVTAFGIYGLNWKDYVEFDESLVRPSEVPILIGDSLKAREIGWEPKYTFEEMIKEMIDAA